MSRAQSSIGKALQLHGDAVEQVEALYLEQAGEVTEETEQAEQARDLAAGQALEELARYRLWVADQREAIDRESERLDKLEAEMIRREEWADEKMAGLVRARNPAARSRRAGTRMVKLRDHYSVQAAPNLDLDTLPPSWLREVQGRPAVAASVALDKVRAKKALQLGYRTGEPPSDGWYECSSPLGRGTLYLFRGAMTGEWRLADRHNGERPVGTKSLASANLTVTGEPDRHVLRWRHHAPGVELACRVSVTVG